MRKHSLGFGPISFIALTLCEESSWNASFIPHVFAPFVPAASECKQVRNLCYVPPIIGVTDSARTFL